MISRHSTAILFGYLLSGTATPKLLEQKHNLQGDSSDLTLLPQLPSVDNPFSPLCLSDSQVCFSSDKVLHDSGLSYFYMPTIDEAFLLKRIVTMGAISKEERLQFAKTVLQVRNSNPIFTHYFDFVLTYLEGFHFILTPDLIPMPGQTSKVHGTFDPSSKALKISIVNPDLLLDTLKHEMRHAAANTIQEILGGKKTNVVDCYYPQAGNEKQKANKALEKGHKRLKRLIQLLDQEATGKISKKDKKTLNTLRADWQKEYSQHYLMHDKVTLENTFVDNFKIELAKQKQKLAAGSVVNWDSLITDSIKGNLRIKKLTRDKTHTRIEFVYEDPLNAAVNKLIYIKEKELQIHYSKETHMYEWDAYMHGALPPSIIRYIYPEFSGYINNLIDQARTSALIPCNDRTFRASITQEETYAKTILALTAIDEKMIDNFQSREMLKLAKDAIEKGWKEEYPAIKGILKWLIKKGEKVEQANLELGRLERMMGHHVEEESRSNYRRR